jgi:hypothetical protein
MMSNQTISFKLTNLKAFTKYAVYVKIYTVKTSAQSDVLEFNTHPGQPEKVVGVKATAKSSSEIVRKFLIMRNFMPIR